MRAGQTMIADDGYEVALFPLTYLYLSQDEGGSYSHSGTYNMDFLGWNENGRVYQAPIYAPCTMKLVAYWTDNASGHLSVFESVNKVHLANGNLDYLTICFAHANNLIYSQIGQIVNQGQICYRTGTYGNVTGDHVHTCCGQGHYQGFTTRVGGHMDLTNRIHYYDGVYVNDTIISVGGSHTWKTYQGGSDPSGNNKKKKFPWVLYARKLRNKRI